MASNDGNSSMEPSHQALCRDFAAITGTDPDLAVYFLSQKSWKLEDALNMFYDDCPSRLDEDGDDSKEVKEEMRSSRGAASKSQSASSSGSSSPDVVLVDQFKPREKSTNINQPSQPSLTEPTPTGYPPPPSPGFCIITWNIDGLDSANVMERTRAVCRLLKSYSPDVIFLQEVIPETCKLVGSQLSNYKSLPAADHAYFTLVLLRKSTVTCLSSKIEKFPGSKMTRALQTVDCKCGGVDLRLMCSHLESTAAQERERRSQLSRVLSLMEAAPAEQTVLFGGDTNLRDKEVAKVGLPSNIRDVWEMCGSPAEANFTWDLTKNDNLNWPYPNRPRLRFDRLFLRHATATPRVKPQNFALVGTERLEPCRRFPSDHWGIVCNFKVTSQPDSAEGPSSKKPRLSLPDSTGASGS